jgi:hypothetical protein
VTEQRNTGTTDSAAEAVAAAIGRLGRVGAGATAAAISAEAGVAYSTTNKKLRILREAGRAQSFDGADNRTLWRLTNAADSAPTPSEQPDTDTSRTDKDGPSAATHGDEDTNAPGAATIANVGDHLLAALDGPAGQPVVVPAVPDQAKPDDDAAVALDGGQAGPPDGMVGADETDDAEADDQEAGAQDADQVDEHETGESDAAAKPARRAAKRTRASAAPPAPGDSDGGGAEGGGDAPARRAGGTLRGAILDILEAHPDRQYKVGEVCKLIDAANAGTDVAKASQGAVANALDTLSRRGTVIRTVDRPATFQLTPSPTD